MPTNSGDAPASELSREEIERALQAVSRISEFAVTARTMSGAEFANLHDDLECVRAALSPSRPSGVGPDPRPTELELSAPGARASLQSHVARRTVLPPGDSEPSKVPPQLATDIALLREWATEEHVGEAPFVTMRRNRMLRVLVYLEELTVPPPGDSESDAPTNAQLEARWALSAILAHLPLDAMQVVFSKLSVPDLDRFLLVLNDYHETIALRDALSESVEARTATPTRHGTDDDDN